MEEENDINNIGIGQNIYHILNITANNNNNNLNNNSDIVSSTNQLQLNN